MEENKSFDHLIDSFLLTKVGHTEGFLSIELCNQLRDHLQTLNNANLLKPSSIGSKKDQSLNVSIRSDKIYWLDHAHNNEYEHAFLDIMDAFILYLNQSCYAGIKSSEFHFALYEKGSFYRRHLDQFKNNQDRAFSMIMYLNDDWQDGDGGEICIYHADSVQLISPQNGHCVFFKSDELEHEVLLNHKPRMSITGWLKRK